jgi:uncharacterized membrane-anchored protein YhcB (DUF1043 family)
MIALLTQWRALTAAAVVAVILGLLALWRLEAQQARRLQDQLQAAATARAGAQAQAAAAGAAEAVIAAGAGRDQRTVTQHMENSHDIQAASGAGQSLDRDLNAAGRRGLCAYAVYQSDPDCLSLRGADPGQRPPAGGADAAAQP